MLLTTLVEMSGGGHSRLGGVIQRGLRIFRQVIRGEGPPVPGAGLEQSLVRLPQNQLSRVIPQTIGGNVFAAVRRGTKGILANYLARNQIQNLAAEMRRRYAVRLMSGSARFYTGLGNRVAIYSFVGISFGGMVHNHAHQGQSDRCDAVEDIVQNLFKNEPEEKASTISENCFAVDEETKLLVVTVETNGEDAFEDDFEVIQENELGLCGQPEAEEARLQELISLRSLVEMLYKDNADLRETICGQTLEVGHLKSELSAALRTVNAQGKELLTLQKTAQNQNELLKAMILNQLQATQTQSRTVKGGGPNPGVSATPRDARYAARHPIGTEVNHTEIDMEQLRAEGGRVRGLKVHRKKRMKNI